MINLAKEGIKIYIILFQEVKNALYNNSSFVKKYFALYSDNIFVIRHPRKNYVGKWSHHEKMLIIDSKVMFMGGIDLCFGRYEVNGYPLFEPEENKTFFFG